MVTLADITEAELFRMGLTEKEIDSFLNYRSRVGAPDTDGLKTLALSERARKVLEKTLQVWAVVQRHCPPVR